MRLPWLFLLALGWPALGQSTILVGRATGMVSGSGSSYACRTLTLDHTKAGASDATNFPVLVRGTYAWLATTANGGAVRNANGYDVGFYTDQTRATKLAWEVQQYTAASGAVLYWVKVPVFSHTTDTSFALCYGDASITTDQSNRAATWNASYAAVWHLGVNGTLTATDSTANGINGTITSAGYGAGVIGGGAVLNGSNTYIDMGAGVAALQPSTVTVSCWFTPAGAQAAYASPVGQDYANPRTGPYTSYDVTVGYSGTSLMAGAYAGISSNAPSGTSVGGTALTSGVPYHLVTTYDGATLKSYVNGVLAGSAAQSGSLVYASSGRFRIGGNSAGSEIPTGTVEEVHVESAAQSADWIAAEYNCGGNTCYSVGAQVTH